MVFNKRARNFEESEVLDTPPPIITREKFQLEETLFLKGDLLPTPRSRKVIDRVP